MQKVKSHPKRRAENDAEEQKDGKQSFSKAVAFLKKRLTKQMPEVKKAIHKPQREDVSSRFAMQRKQRCMRRTTSYAFIQITEESDEERDTQQSHNKVNFMSKLEDTRGDSSSQSKSGSTHKLLKSSSRTSLISSNSNSTTRSNFKAQYRHRRHHEIFSPNNNLY